MKALPKSQKAGIAGVGWVFRNIVGHKNQPEKAKMMPVHL